ncbi:IucA/IucC family protein [Streptomyces sp. M19]
MPRRGDDEHLAQQSIRTFFNTTDPAKHYVKTALSVLNMGFMRGLSAAYMEATPAINDWLAGLIEDDPVLRRAGSRSSGSGRPSATGTPRTRPRRPRARRT